MKIKDAVRIAVNIMEQELNRMAVRSFVADEEEAERYAKIASAIKALQSLPESML